MRTVLVTGGRGFTGRHITRRLVESGHRVVSYDRTYPVPDNRDVIGAQGELFDIPRLMHVLRERGVDAIIHTAAMSHPTLSLDFPIGTFTANVDGTLGVFEAARVTGVRRVVNFSSETVYGRADGPIDERTPVSPSTPYAVTKVATEWLGHVYKARYDVEVVSLRIAQVYGPGNKMPEVLGDMLKSVRVSGRFALDRGGDHGFNFIHVDDVATAALAALAAPGPFALPAYNVSSAEYWRLSDAVDLACRLLPEATIEIGPGLVPELDLQGPFAIDAARHALGFEPRWTLERGLSDYTGWLRTHHA